MVVTKANVAAIAYRAIHEQFEDIVPYEEKLRLVIDVVEILKCMAETEDAQYLDSRPKACAGAVE